MGKSWISVHLGAYEAEVLDSRHPRPSLGISQLLPHQHGRPDHPRVRRAGDPDLRTGRGARAHAEAPGPREQVSVQVELLPPV